MSLRRWAMLAALLLAAQAGTSMADEDPNIWLEDIHGQKALEFVAKENTHALQRLTGDPRYAAYRAAALKIFTAKDRIPYPEFRGQGIDNLWQDDAHPHGLWRETTLSSYRAGRPKWRTLLDLDALSKQEGKNWFLKGADCLPPDERLCLIRLSDGGGDAVEIREFDAQTKTFVGSGFALDRAKQDVEWIDRDRIIVARAFTEAEATESGYASVLRIVKRGQAPQGAKIVFRGAREDTLVTPRVLRDENGTLKAVIAERRVGFFEAEYHLLDGGTPVKLPLPLATTLRGLVDGKVIFSLQTDWNGFQSGALVAIDLAAVQADASKAAQASMLVFAPTASQTIDSVQTTKSRVVIQLLDNVKGAIEVWKLKDSHWEGSRLDLPKDSLLTVRAAQKSAETLFVTSESFLQPVRLWSVDAASTKKGLVASLPAKFKATTHRMEQIWATSKDGTKIPYFLIVPKKQKANGSMPTLLFGYGGFQLSKPPVYLPEMGKLWLEHGGAYVIANIRGGGEFGPRWHQSAMREHRQRAFDDFAAVAEDLIARKITTPRRLGIYGRSNGGVLTTVSMIQRPDLFNAVVVESPLIDMLRYHKLSAGASWVGEYGNPDLPADHAFIAAYSAYQNLKPGTHYPEPYITTNTEDDRVHPGHARKFAARLSQMGLPYLYFENTFGGHSNDADPKVNAERWARHYIYLAQKLMD